MMFLHRHPPHIRRKVALIVTGVVAAGLLALLVVTLASKKDETESAPQENAGEKLQDFYESAVDSSRSLFDGN